MLPDAAAAGLLASGAVDVVLTGADRIAADGSVANKVGTYGLAVLARHHAVPFVVVAPVSTIDFGTADGSGDRASSTAPAEEVTTLAGQPIAPAGSAGYNPAFDVTPTCPDHRSGDRAWYCTAGEQRYPACAGRSSRPAGRVPSPTFPWNYEAHERSCARRR